MHFWSGRSNRIELREGEREGVRERRRKRERERPREDSNLPRGSGSSFPPLDFGLNAAARTHRARTQDDRRRATSSTASFMKVRVRSFVSPPRQFVFETGSAKEWSLGCVNRAS